MMSEEQLLRVENELDELHSKIVKLRDFMNSETFDSISNLQKLLLLQQLNVMQSYENILSLRIRVRKE